MLIALCLGSAALPVTMFSLMAGSTLAVVGAIVLALLAGAVSAVGAVATAEQFPGEGRITGLALGATMATAIFGGLTPFGAQWLVERTGWTMAPGAMIALVALCVAPVLLTTGESIAARTRPSGTRVLVLAAALGGLVLVSASAGPSSGGSHPVLGVLLAAGSGTTYAVATGIGRPLTGLTTPLALTTATSTAGALALLPFGVLGGGPYLPHTPAVAGLLVYLGVATLAVAYALLYAGLRTVQGSAALVATLLEPLTAAVLAAVLLGERLGRLGVVLILAAVAGLEEESDEDGPVPEGPAPL